MSAPVSDPLQFGSVDNGERAPANLDHARALQFAKNLADMNRRQPGRIRNVALTQREVEGLRTHRGAPGNLLRQSQDQAGDAFVSAATSEIERELIGARVNPIVRTAVP
jgi:hypothetical protein